MYERENDTLTLSLHAEISRFIIRAGNFIDQKNYTDFAALFTENGRLYRPTTSEPLIGPAAIQASYESNPKNRVNRHLISNQLIELHSNTDASSQCYVTLYSTEEGDKTDCVFGAPVHRCLVGAFQDRLIHRNGQWWFSERRAEFTFNVTSPEINA